ncbi:MAG: hypothetical protein ABI601_10125 [bacterium]
MRWAPPTTGMGQRSTGANRSKGASGCFRGGAAIALVVMAFAGCSGADAVIPTEEDPVIRISAPEGADGIDEAEQSGALPISPTTIAVTTYEGSGELVHPDVAFFPRGWWGVRYWFSATPYPGGDSGKENPSIFNGAVAGEMNLPAGATNPLGLPEVNSYLSDPDISYDPDRSELRMYYRQTVPLADQIYLTKSANGVTWSKRQLVLSAGRYALISPAVVREGTGKWRMWTVNAVGAGCRISSELLVPQQRRSSDGISWGDAEPVTLKIPGRVPWHWDVQYVRAKGEYWSMIAAYPDGTNCSQTALYFARSTDGSNWSVSPAPLLRAGDYYPIRDLVYRSTFRYHEGSDAVSVWFSGARMEEGAFHYGVALARYPMDELLRRVSGSAVGTQERGNMERPSRELRAARAAFIANFP